MKKTKQKQIESKFQARQGDVWIERVDDAPPDDAKLVPKDRGRVVLAYGEQTGHAHAFASKASAQLFRKDDEALTAYLVIEGVPATLRHEEHAAIELPPGNYKITIQREYAPDAIRAVAD